MTQYSKAIQEIIKCSQGTNQRSQRLKLLQSKVPEATETLQSVSSLIKKVFNISQIEWRPHIQHHRKLDDLRTGFEVLGGVALCHGTTFGNHPYRLKIDLT